MGSTNPPSGQELPLESPIEQVNQASRWAQQTLNAEEDHATSRARQPREPRVWCCPSEQGRGNLAHPEYGATLRNKDEGKFAARGLHRNLAETGWPMRRPRLLATSSFTSHAHPESGATLRNKDVTDRAASACIGNAIPASWSIRCSRRSRRDRMTFHK